ncbi:MAG: discoidin domain-containing protein [Ekhidna sp.]|uniref:discoidin domain-containing protein n=1 Tax=Ekhidna sp. TaxID=2608089 RepID=UPI0032EC72B7
MFPLPSPKPTFALNKPVTVTSTHGSHQASNAVDGDADTRWVSQVGTPQSIEVDLQGIYSVSSITINTFSVANGFYVEYWDENNWITLVTEINNKSLIASRILFFTMKIS